MADSANESFFQRHHFFLRRLHSLTGIIPIGVFLCVHLTINSTIIHGAAAFQTAVEGIHLLDRVGMLGVVEFVFIFLPLLFHGVLGVQIWLTGKFNVTTHQYGGNVRYTLQRITGLIAFAFILYHLWHMHWLGQPLGGGLFQPHNAAASAANALGPWYLRGIYAIGLLAAVFHFANGIWTFLITWGIVIGPQAQRKVGWVCAAIGVLLALAGLGSLRGFGQMVAQPQQPEGPTAEMVAQVDHAP
ncbi:MAG TPA: succinate dehydrogenase [Phycisphaerae bacterium]|nr:succinate dehydrogenase [Phycisphaerae bacterium]